MILVSFALMVIGILMMLFAVFKLLVLIIKDIVGVGSLIGYTFFMSIYNQFFLDKALRDSDYAQKKYAQQRTQEELERMVKEQENNARIKSEHDALVSLTLKKYNRLKALYPLADNALFAQFLQVCNTGTIAEEQEIASQIEKQHFTRYNARQEVGICTIEDIANLQKLQTKFSGQYRLDIYANPKDASFVVTILDLSTQKNMMYVASTRLLAEQIVTYVVADCYKHNNKMDESNLSDSVKRAVKDYENAL